MTAPVLLKSLGDGGAALDGSHGAPSVLRDVLSAMAKETGARLNVSNATPSVATVATYVATREGCLQSFRLKLGTCGTANANTAALRVNGTAVATLSIDNAETDGTQKEALIDPPKAIIPGDVVTIAVTAIATGAANLTADAVVQAACVQ